VPDDAPVLTVANARAWSRWLAKNSDNATGVWLVLAKKGTTDPTSLTYDEALEEALCFGWVDGKLAKGDDRTFRRRFTPRRAAGAWSKRNVSLAQRLNEEGRMQRGGLAAVERAKANGSWDRAYEGQAEIEVPTDLASALGTNDAAKENFDHLNAANRYAVLYRVATATSVETRLRRIDQLVAMLARGETHHPQRDTSRGRHVDD